MKKPFAIVFVLLAWGLSPSGSCMLHAAPLWSGGTDWNALSFRPLENEQTPNFYGYGLNLGAGYRVLNELGAGIYGSYNILNEGAAKFFQGDSSNLGYGLELAGRFEESVFIAFRYGRSALKIAGDGIEEEFLGSWDAALWGGSVGGYWRSGREEYIQVGLQYLNGYAARTLSGSSDLLERRVDMISFYVTYLKMGKVSSRRPFSLY